jgi:hypothetical protein
LICFDSRIISGTPELFSEFRGKQMELLWRGSRDSFRASEFHRRCDGHSNTLSVILDSDGNIFGGFTPMEWESLNWNGKIGKEDNRRKVDDSLKSFLFTLKNPHNVPPRKFELRMEKKDQAISCHRERGPNFCGIHVSDHCNVNNEIFAWLGIGYVNDTGISGDEFFTGSLRFVVREIEIFEILM